MVKNVEVIVETESFIMSEKSKNIIGEIYVSLEDDVYFPQFKWTDFVVVILGWWLEAILKISTAKENTSTKLMFMDGPIYMRAIKVSNDIIEIELIERDVVQKRFECSINQFTNSLQMAAKKVLSDIENRNWETRDIDSLKRTLSQVL